MAIVFGSDTGIVENSLDTFWSKITSDFSNTLDGIQSAFSTKMLEPPIPPKESVHVDGGFTNVPGTSFLGSGIDNIDDIKQRNIISQEPSITVYVKKRAFWALRNENNLKYLDAGEKLFLRATKILFEKKCSQIAAYESMSKMQRLLSEEADLDYERIEILAAALQSATDDLSDAAQKDFQGALKPTLSQNALDVLQTHLNNALEKAGDISNMASGLMELAIKSKKLASATTTTWVIDHENPDLFSVGRGSGVIELTLVSDLNTALSLDNGNEGSIDFSIQDPYNLTKISNEDIESALNAAVSEVDWMLQLGSGSRTERFLRGPQYYLEEARRKEEQLRRMRSNKVVGTFDRVFGSNLSQDSGNNVLGNTDAPEIIFEVNTSSSAPNKVIGTLSSQTTTFTKNDFRIVMLSQPLEYQLSPSEDQLVVEIFDMLEQYVTELSGINTSYREANASPDMKHARINLRKHYLGKNIIQPMDSVHIYARGRTIKTEQLAGPLSALLDGTMFVSAFATDDKVSDAMLEQEMELFGIKEFEIPTDIYKSIRTSSLMKNAGTHIFGGIVRTVSEDYSAESGVYTTRINGTNNMSWLNLSRINTSPSLDQTQGLLEDPLTPFDIETQKGTGLLVDHPPLNAENQRRLDMHLLKHPIGEHAGKELTDKDTESERANIINDWINSGEGDVQPQLKHIPGVVYKWKNGIIAATRNVNLQTALDGSEDQYAKLRRDMGVSVVQNVFSGLDAADIISLLVTGQPHNYETFFKHSTSVGTFNIPDGHSSQTYFSAFFNIMRSQNQSLGNFLPIKIIEQSQQTMRERLNMQHTIREGSKTLNGLYSEQAVLKDRRNTLTTSGLDGDTQGQEIAQSLDSLISAKDKQISDERAKLQVDRQAAEQSGMRLYGNDIAFEFAEGNASSDEDQNQTMHQMRLRNTLIQQRLQYDCKFNKDNNLFVIGDEYDKDLDIQAYVISAIGSQQIDMWTSQFQTPLEVCGEVAKTIDFEFFCDSQGFIQFRPPRYNKVPLSLILKLFVLDQRENKKLYPDFLSSLFQTRSESYENELAITDANITVEVALLGGNTIVDVEKLSNELVKSGNIEDVSKPSIPNTSIEIEKQLGNQTTALIEASKKLNQLVGGNELTDEDAEKKIRALNDPHESNMYTNRLTHIKKLEQLISTRQRLSEIVEKARTQGKKYNVDVGNVNLSSNPTPEMLEPIKNLIEDDYNDYLGPGSSKRYIIHDDQIISYNFTESDQNVFCHVEVNGQQDLLGEQPGVLGGIPALWAGATDFDLWRQYGFRKGEKLARPFIKNAESQAAPYAVMLLNRVKKNVVIGSVTVYGNEYYQLGDVVYINSRDMLYYVNGIRHNFSYGGTFTTTLDLKYGHALGEYIPTPLDVIGKGVFKVNNKANKVVTSRETASISLGVHLGAAKFAGENTDRDEFKAMLSGDFAFLNEGELKNALVKANLYIGEDKKESYPKVEVRGFLTKESLRDVVRKRIEAVVRWLQEPCGRYIASGSEDRYIIISGKRYVSKHLTNNQISLFREPILITGKLEPYQSVRLPKEEVYNLTYDGTPDHIIEIVLIFQEIEGG